MCVSGLLPRRGLIDTIRESVPDWSLAPVVVFDRHSYPISSPDVTSSFEPARRPLEWGIIAMSLAAAVDAQGPSTRSLYEKLEDYAKNHGFDCDRLLLACV